MLGKTQRSEQSEWLSTIEMIESIVPRENLEHLVDRTVERIRNMTRGKKVAYSWSGGKDSLVLQGLCTRVGINECMLAVTSLEYGDFLLWLSSNKPAGLEIINTGQDLEWLAKHPNMLFPQTSHIAAQWFHIVQHRAQEIYCKKRKYDLLILGRRKIDGNYVGKGNIYTARGVTRYSPMADWSHEDILAYIHYHNLNLPPFYKYKKGYLCSTHPWPARQYTGSIHNGWREIYDIDKAIVVNAAKYLNSAEVFLERLG
jgi:3'-phosphoadenosine 5'-phosphosulfate sulfotransferase (PAPS reductase)/FAD synthetase